MLYKNTEEFLGHILYLVFHLPASPNSYWCDVIIIPSFLFFVYWYGLGGDVKLVSTSGAKLMFYNHLVWLLTLAIIFFLACFPRVTKLLNKTKWRESHNKKKNNNNQMNANTIMKLTKWMERPKHNHNNSQVFDKTQLPWSPNNFNWCAVCVCCETAKNLKHRIGSRCWIYEYRLGWYYVCVFSLRLLYGMWWN